MGDYHHLPVMVAEVLAHLDCSPGKVIVDGTLGGCGHALAILERIGPEGFLIGIDRDAEAIENARRRLASIPTRTDLIHDNFKRLDAILDRLEVDRVDGILVDLGLSLHQIRGSGRGFSFETDEPLDMRMDVRDGRTAADLVNTLPLHPLADLFYRYGEERWSRRIARSIVTERRREPIRSSRRLAGIVSAAVPHPKGRRERIHPATRVFMALRIAVNEELEGLDRFIEAAAARLHPGGRLCVLGFHSLEDRIVKQTLRRLALGCVCPPHLPHCACGRRPLIRVLTRKALRPAPEEVARNPMARSTRLRAAQRLDP